MIYRTPVFAIGLAMVLSLMSFARELDGGPSTLAVAPETIKGPEEDSYETPLDSWRAAWWPNSAVGAGATVRRLQCHTDYGRNARPTRLCSAAASSSQRDPRKRNDAADASSRCTLLAPS